MNSKRVLTVTILLFLIITDLFTLNETAAETSFDDIIYLECDLQPQNDYAVVLTQTQSIKNQANILVLSKAFQRSQNGNAYTINLFVGQTLKWTFGSTAQGMRSDIFFWDSLNNCAKLIDDGAIMTKKGVASYSIELLHYGLSGGSIRINVLDKSEAHSNPDTTGGNNTPAKLDYGSDVKDKVILFLNSPKMMCNGTEREIDPGRGTVPILYNNRTLVPIRAIIESMGGSVAWDGQTQKVTINYKVKKIELWIGMKQTKVNGVSQESDVAPMTVNSRTMLPLRFVTEKLGYGVVWDPDTKKITINYGQTNDNSVTLIMKGQHMEPTIKSLSKVVFTKIDPKDFIPSRGNIVAFNHAQFTADDGEYIMRIIGLPGDTIEIKDSCVYINNKRIEESYTKGETYPMPWIQPNPITIPEGHVYVLGDNRENANDSRSWGTLKIEDIKYLMVEK